MPYDVWRIPFRYVDDPLSVKERPAVVASVDGERALVLVLKVTGHGPRPEYPGEVRLVDWKEAGLDKPSTVRCSKQLIMSFSDFSGFTKYGRLSIRDAWSVSEALAGLAADGRWGARQV